MYIHYLAKLKEGGMSFLEGVGKGGAGWDHPKLRLLFYETKNVSIFVKFE